jgi:hypothetical protein
VRFHEPIGDHSQQLRQDGADLLPRIEELDDYRKVLPFYTSGVTRMHLSMETKAGVSSIFRGTRNAMPMQKGNDVIGEKAARRTGISVEIHRYLER